MVSLRVGQVTLVSSIRISDKKLVIGLIRQNFITNLRCFDIIISMGERVTVDAGWGKRLVLEGKGKVTAKKDSVVVSTYQEEAYPRTKGTEKASGFVFPPGTIASMKPLLKDVYQVSGIERDEAYWLQIDEEAIYSVKYAWRKIREANKGMGGVTFETVAKVTLETDPQLFSSRTWKDISNEGVSGLVSLLAARILKASSRKVNPSVR